MSEYTTKDSGERQDFSSGARRDISHGKTRPDLISAKARQRWGDLMGRGAEKYGARNWELGMPASRFLESAYRHLLNYELGDRDEDHLAAVLFNIGAMIHFEGTEWDDINGEIDEEYELTEYGRSLLDGLCHERDEQLELQPADENVDLINWDKVAKDAEKDWSQGPGSPWNS